MTTKKKVLIGIGLLLLIGLLVPDPENETAPSSAASPTQPAMQTAVVAPTDATMDAAWADQDAANAALDTALAERRAVREETALASQSVPAATPSERPATSPTDTPCTPTELSPAAVELVRLYEELHTFKDDTEFLDMGFSQAGPYHAWMEAVKAHQDANSGWVLFDELGFAANEVLMLGMNYMDEDPNASDLSAIEFFETKIQAGLALTRCAEPGTAVQDIARTSAEVRRAYVDPLARPPAGADDIDERVLNPCITAGIARNPELDGVTPWEIRNIYPEIYDPLVAQGAGAGRADTGGVRRRRARQEHPSRQVP